MTQTDAAKQHKCAFCEYKTKRKHDLKRHQNAKHLSKINRNIATEQNVSYSGQNVSPSNYYCMKCNKEYKIKKNCEKHENECNKVDCLTCPRCMISFTTRAAKSRHIKSDKCKARSIIHARTPNIQNITNNGTYQNAETIQNINHVYINNFGFERIDHISDDDLKRILQSGINTVPLYIERKHFDNNFPENKNIKYTNDNKCQVMEGNTWKEKDIILLSNNLIKDNSEVLLMYCDSNEVKLLNEIKDEDLYDHIRNKLLIIYNKTDDHKYNQILSKIKDLIKNSKD
jgi:hypothetical protein